VKFLAGTAHMSVLRGTLGHRDMGPHGSLVRLARGRSGPDVRRFGPNTGNLLFFFVFHVLFRLGFKFE
jgi:hypothetical protein